VRVGDGLLGRVLNGLGQPVDGKGTPKTVASYPVKAPAPNPMHRARVGSIFQTGIKAIDGILTAGEGQRIGIFAAAGVGKSELLGMLARHSESDVNVIALIGERGREVRDFLEDNLGEKGLRRSVVVVATSNEPAMVRLKAAHVATAIAEYFRDQKRRVVLLFDSVTRFARALREVGLTAGEPPTRVGFPPSVFAELPKLFERAGNSAASSITAFYTVLVEGDDMTEPIADETISILDGHIVLSRNLAAAGHFPAIDINRSISRVMPKVIAPRHGDVARKLRQVLATYEAQKDLIMIGAYKKGSDPRTDYALSKLEAVNAFLQQGIDEHVESDRALQELEAIFA